MKTKNTPEQIKEKQELRSKFIVEHYSELCEYIDQSYQSHLVEMTNLQIELEDFRNIIFRNMIIRQGFENFDGNKTRSLRALVFSLCKREMIDQFRKQNTSKTTDFLGKKIVTVSIYTEIGDSLDGSFTLGDTIPYQGNAEEGISGIIEMVPQEKIPGMDYTWRDLIKMIIKFSEDKILEILKIKYYEFLKLKEQLKKFFPDYQLS